MTMKKIIALIVFSIFTTTAFAQIGLDSTATERKVKIKRSRARKIRRIKRPKH